MEVGTGVSSKLRSSKSTKGEAAGFATPFESLSEAPEGNCWLDFSVEIFACDEPALLEIKIDSSKTGILSTKEDLHMYNKFWNYRP